MELDKLAEMTGIPIRDIHEAIGISELIDNVTKAENAYLNSPSGIAGRLAFEHWVSLCTTIEEIGRAHDTARKCTEARILAFEKWNAISLEEVEKASTRGVAYRVFIDAPSNSKSKRLAFEKFLSLCVTVDEARDAYRSTPDDSAIRILAFERWNALSLEEAERVVTCEEAYTACIHAPVNSKSRRLAFEKWVSLCTTIEEVIDAYNFAPDESEYREFAFNKWVSLCVTISDLNHAYGSTDNVQAQQLAIAKIVDIFTTQEAVVLSPGKEQL